METPAETLNKFREVCRRLGLPPQRMGQAIQTNWMNAVRDALTLSRVRAEVQTRFRYLQEVQAKMPRKKATPPPTSIAQEAAPVAAPVAALPDLPSLPEMPTLPTTVSGLDGLAQGVTPEAIQASIAAVTGTASTAGDAVVATALIDLRDTLAKIQEAQEVLDNRIVALQAEVQKSNVALAQRVDGVQAEVRQGVMGLQATIREVLDSLGSEEAPAAAPAKEAPAPAGPSPILQALAGPLAQKGNPAYPDRPDVWQAFAALVSQMGVSANADEVRSAFVNAGRLNGGAITY